MNNQGTESGTPKSRTLLAGWGLALAIALSAACGESTEPPVIGAIQGTVTVEGAGLDGVSVSLGGGGSGSTTTSGGGNYSFPGLEAGQYSVTISGFANDIEFDQTSGNTTVATAGRAQVVDFGGTYIRTASVTGTVSVNDEGVEGVSVSVSGTESKSGSTGADGTFTVSSLRVGSYTVEISGYDERRYVFDPTSQQFSVALGQTETVDFAGMIGELDFTIRIENVSMPKEFSFSGALATPLNSAEAGPLLPGMSYGYNFDAPPGSHVSFATMFVQSNDLFYAPDGMGIALWDDDGGQVSGDVTDQVMLWDAGTEMNEEPGSGAHQPLRGAGGEADEDPNVRVATDDFDNLPDVADVIQVTVEPIGPAAYHLRITNVSEETMLMTADGGEHAIPLAPGVAVVHTAPNPLFTAGEPDRGEGLEGLAETGDIEALLASVTERTGLTAMLAPGAYASHMGSGVLFMAGTAASAGLEAMAEDGNPMDLASEAMDNENTHASGAFATPMGGAAAGMAGPGEAYEFTVAGRPGDMLSFATMFVQSNDLFYAPSEDGIALFPDGARPFSGDATEMVMLWDAGTELNERPGSGLNQAPRQSGPNTGTTEMEMVNLREVCFVYPDITNVMDFIKVTITPN